MCSTVVCHFNFHRENWSSVLKKKKVVAHIVLITEWRNLFFSNIPQQTVNSGIQRYSKTLVRTNTTNVTFARFVWKRSLFHNCLPLLSTWHCLHIALWLLTRRKHRNVCHVKPRLLKSHTAKPLGTSNAVTVTIIRNTENSSFGTYIYIVLSTQAVQFSQAGHKW